MCAIAGVGTHWGAPQRVPFPKRAGYESWSIVFNEFEPKGMRHSGVGCGRWSAPRSPKKSGAKRGMTHERRRARPGVIRRPPRETERSRKATRPAIRPKMGVSEDARDERGGGRRGV